MKNKDTFTFYEATLSVCTDKFDEIPVITQFGRTPGDSFLKLGITLSNWDRRGSFKKRAKAILDKNFKNSAYKSFRKKLGKMSIHKAFQEVSKGVSHKAMYSHDNSYSVRVFKHEV